MHCRGSPSRTGTSDTTGRGMPVLIGFWLFVAALFTPLPASLPAEHLVFLSTQLRPIEEAQKMRNLILKDFSRTVDYITERPERFSIRVAEDVHGQAHEIDLVGALHGELQPLAGLE